VRESLTFPGIGLAFVKLAHEQGAKVIIADLKLHSDAAKIGITTKTPGIVFQTCDVTKWDQLSTLFTVSEERFGDVPDIYVANAGIFESVSSVLLACEDSGY
jgi:NAD(P)-dependent dehydrogenase (short-subunit alcohol dehydrogenase family)